jgi:voltage-gated potassium channel
MSVGSKPDGEASRTEVKERFAVLREVEGRLELPMVLLGFVWLLLLVLEFTRGLSPALESVSTAIWIIFIADFAVKLLISPRKFCSSKSIVLPNARIPRFKEATTFTQANASRGPRQPQQSNRSTTRKTRSAASASEIAVSQFLR